MTFWRQLKWRIVAANMLVVLVGVVVILVMAYLISQAIVSQSIFTAVLIAALGAILVGLLMSFLLAREILRPLQQLALSSQRIADGHYDERVPMPSSDELSQVATNFNHMAATLAGVEQTRVALIGDVSHELRTPLTSLAGYLEGMLDNVFPSNEETFALMYHEVRRMRLLVNDLQTLSRVEAGQITLNPIDFDVAQIVAQVVAQLRPQLVDQALELEMELPTTAVTVHADPDRTAQILLNLLGNALGYTPENGRIIVSVLGNGRYAMISVTDNGIGISSEALPYLFERFYRADSSRTRGSGGSGIGLTISRHLAWAMGGELFAASDGPGKGSTFSLTLPLD